MVIRKVLVDSFGTLMSPKPPGVVGQYVSSQFQTQTSSPVSFHRLSVVQVLRRGVGMMFPGAGGGCEGSVRQPDKASGLVQSRYSL